MSNRPFDFTDKVKNEAYSRQGGLCAVCCRPLRELETHAHHVIPNQSGDPLDPNHQWLKESDNCVWVCDTCHYVVHGGNTRTGGVAPPQYFTCSWGPKRENAARVQQWSAMLNSRADALFASARKRTLKELEDFAIKMQNEIERQANFNQVQFDLYSQSLMGYWSNKLFNSPPPHSSIWTNAQFAARRLLKAVRAKDLAAAANEIPSLVSQYYSAFTRFYTWYNGVEAAGQKMQVAIWVTALSIVLIVACAAVVSEATALIAQSSTGASSVAMQSAVRMMLVASTDVEVVAAEKAIEKVVQEEVVSIIIQLAKAA